MSESLIPHNDPLFRRGFGFVTRPSVAESGKRQTRSLVLVWTPEHVADTANRSELAVSRRGAQWVLLTAEQEYSAQFGLSTSDILALLRRLPGRYLRTMGSREVSDMRLRGERVWYHQDAP